MTDNTSNRRVRKALDHSTHFHGRFGAIYFITICCQSRDKNQLCHSGIAEVIFETARRYHALGRWHLHLQMFMPDHVHGLIGIDGDMQLSNIIRDFKRITARSTEVKWQRNFFDHRVRDDENLTAKAEYIRDNPIRVGLVGADARWPYILEVADLAVAGD